MSNTNTINDGFPSLILSKTKEFYLRLDRYWVLYPALTIVFNLYFLVELSNLTFLVLGSGLSDSGFSFFTMLSLWLIGVAQLANILICVALFKALKGQKALGINLAALSLILALISGSWLLMIIGGLVFSSKPFSGAAFDWSPEWYKKYIIFLGGLNL